MGWFEKALIIFYGVGIPLAFICTKIDEKSEKEKKELEEKIRREQPFFCPYCGTKNYYSDHAHGRYTCFECRRTIIHDREATDGELAEIRKEEADIAAVQRYLNDQSVFQRVMDSLRIPHFFVGTISAHRAEYGNIVKITGCTRTADPYNPLDDKREDFEPVSIPIGFPIKTAAGEAVFHRALLDYIQSNYSHVYRANMDSSRSGVSIGIK